MKTVLLMRHAKSDRAHWSGVDHDRPLAVRGREAAGAMGRFMAAADLVPDRALSSTAIRASETLDLLISGGGWQGVTTERRESLYGAGPGEVWRVVERADRGESRLLLVGHEPGWSESVYFLTGGARVRMATGMLARIDFEAERWEDCRPGSGLLSGLFPPRAIVAALH